MIKNTNGLAYDPELDRQFFADFLGGNWDPNTIMYHPTKKHKAGMRPRPKAKEVSKKEQ
jgi:hypothetical protein